MGADENAAIVRRDYEAFNAADMETLTELFDESASWHTPGRSPIAGDHAGRTFNSTLGMSSGPSRAGARSAGLGGSAARHS